MSQVHSRPVRPTTRGPVLLAFELLMGLVMVSLSAVIMGIFIEIGGSYTIWKHRGALHARSLVEQDLGYIAAAPRSLLVSDTVAFSEKMIGYIAWPYQKFGLLGWSAKAPADSPSDRVDAVQPPGKKSLAAALRRNTEEVKRFFGTWLEMSMYVAMDVALRLSIALYALPAFVLACLVGAVDGLVRRDLRRWSGGRESSFVYHHAKRYTAWALTGGFGLYLAWPFGGFNPALMVLVFTVLVAATLSTTIAAFKKYV